MYACMHACMHACTHARRYVRTYAYTHACIIYIYKNMIWLDVTRSPVQSNIVSLPPVLYTCAVMIIGQWPTDGRKRRISDQRKCVGECVIDVLIL